jgi:hypothetical protein
MAPCKEIGLPATWTVALGSSEVILRRTQVPGPCQSSATRPKRSVRPLVWLEWGWENNLPCGGKEGQSTLQCPFWPHCGQGPGSRRGEWHFFFFFAQCPIWLNLKQAPGGMCCPALFEDGGGGLRAVAKSWALWWSRAFSQLLNTLNAIFTRSPWRV